MKKLFLATLFMVGVVFVAPTHAAAQSSCISVSFSRNTPGYGYLLTNNCGVVENVAFATPSAATTFYLDIGQTIDVSQRNNQPYKVWNCPSGTPYDPNGNITYNSTNVRCRQD